MCPSFPPQGFTIKNFLERFYPAIGYPIKDGWIGDFFARLSLIPTGCPTIYTETFMGAGSGAINSSGFYLQTTAAAVGDDADLRIDHVLLRNPAFTQGTIRNLTGIIDLYMTFQIPVTTLVEGFIGITLGSNAALAALPTTAGHMGIYWDISVGANFILSSADGTTQSTTDTTIAVDDAIHTLHIRWTGQNAAILELMDTTNIIQGTTRTVTALNSLNTGFIHSFVQTETIAARILRLYNWIARIA